jgi:phosphatidylserine decarboxylase
MKISLGSGYMLNVHTQGRIFVLISGVATVISALTLGIGVITILLLFATLSIIAFFRDPERVVPKEEDDILIVSPGDGKIVDISSSAIPSEVTQVDEKEMTKISIFLSVFDVHVNRMPVAGKITEVKYNPGKFLNASLNKASKDNERNAIVIESENGEKIICVQIAGFVARRIVCDAEEGEFFPLGERYGIIKFGSRLDVYVPSSAELKVSVGQLVIGGETILGSINN